MEYTLIKIITLSPWKHILLLLDFQFPLLRKYCLFYLKVKWMIPKGYILSNVPNKRTSITDTTSNIGSTYFNIDTRKIIKGNFCWILLCTIKNEKNVSIEKSVWRYLTMEGIIYFEVNKLFPIRKLLNQPVILYYYEKNYCSKF